MDPLKSWPLGKTGPQGLNALPFFSSNMKGAVEVIHFHIIFYMNLVFSYFLYNFRVLKV